MDDDMSTSYGAAVFYGTYVESESALGKRLDKFIDKHGGSPAPCGVRGVEISSVGSLNGDPSWITIQAKGSAVHINAGEDIEAPSLLDSKAEWDSKVRGFLAKIGEMKTPLPRIGWHFAAYCG